MLQNTRVILYSTTMAIKFKHKGNFKKTENLLDFIVKQKFLHNLNKYGRRGVEALRLATPVDTGLTARSWDYRIEKKKDQVSIIWTNSNIVDGYPIAIILDYGHGTGGGGYVKGRHFIAPAIQPIFDEIAEDAWKEVSNA